MTLAFFNQFIIILHAVGVDDHVRCFACDGGLRKWDSEDNPWIEHCRWFPACPYALEVKGFEFIELVQASVDDALMEVHTFSVFC